MSKSNRRSRVVRQDRISEWKNRNLTREKIEDYCKWLDSCEKSSVTVQKYRYHLNQFMEFVNERPITKGEVMGWKASLRENLAPVTVNGAIAAVNGYFRKNGLTDCTARFLKVSKSPFMQEDRELSKEDYMKLVKCAYANRNERLAVLLETICSCGIRISELAFITVEAIQKEKAQVECKGRIRTVLLPAQLCCILKEYAKKKGITGGMIFITRTGRALDRSNVWREMKALSEGSGVGKEKIFPHNLRHLFARTYYAIKKDLSKLADILGHRDVNTTRIYTMEKGSEHRKQIESLDLLYTPYNRISLLL